MYVGPSLDHLIRSQQQRRRDGEADGLGRLEVDDQLELRRLLDREIPRLRALEDLVDEESRAPEEIRVVRAVTDESTSLDPLLRPDDTGQAVCEGEIGDPLATGKKR